VMTMMPGKAESPLLASSSLVEMIDHEFSQRFKIDGATQNDYGNLLLTHHHHHHPLRRRKPISYSSQNDISSSIGSSTSSLNHASSKETLTTLKLIQGRIF
jgi:hypothetical protein